MKKKNYLAPQQTVVILKSRTCLLAGSGEGSIDKMNEQFLFNEEEPE